MGVPRVIKLVGVTILCGSLVGLGVGGQPLDRAGALIVVCPEGPPACHFSSIQAAIDAARSGDIIIIAKEGTYRERLRIVGKDIELRGAVPGLDDPQKFVIDGSGGSDPVIYVERAEVRVVGLDLRNGYPGVKIVNGTMIFEWCQLMKNKGAGVWDVGNVRLEFHKCKISGTQKAWHLFPYPNDARDGSAIVAEPEHREKGERGYELKLVIEDSVIEDNEGYGVWAIGGRARIERSLIRNNGRGGIQLGPPSPPYKPHPEWPWKEGYLPILFDMVEIRNNRIEGNGQGPGIGVNAFVLIGESNLIRHYWQNGPETDFQIRDIKEWVGICELPRGRDPLYRSIRRVPKDYNSIQKAIDAASSGDIILIQAGEYKEDRVVIDGKDLSLRACGEPQIREQKGIQDFPGGIAPAQVRVIAPVELRNSRWQSRYNITLEGEEFLFRIPKDIMTIWALFDDEGENHWIKYELLRYFDFPLIYQGGVSWVVRDGRSFSLITHDNSSLAYIRGTSTLPAVCCFAQSTLYIPLFQQEQPRERLPKPQLFIEDAFGAQLERFYFASIRKSELGRIWDSPFFFEGARVFLDNEFRTVSLIADGRYQLLRNIIRKADSDYGIVIEEAQECGGSRNIDPSTVHIFGGGNVIEPHRKGDTCPRWLEFLKR
jgi:hypothetical protein